MVVNYRKYSDQDQPKIDELLDAVFGANYHKSKTYSSNHHFTIVAEQQGRIIGVAIGEILKQDLGVLDLICVDASFRNQGIGKELFVRRLKEFERKQISDLRLNHWVRLNEFEPRLGIKFGFEFVEEIIGYWKEVSLKLNSSCAECGPPPCSCRCRVYKKSTQ